MARTERLRFLVSPVMKKRLEVAAQIEGESLSAWARHTLDREARKSMRSIETTILKGGLDGRGPEVVVFHVGRIRPSTV